MLLPKRYLHVFFFSFMSSMRMYSTVGWMVCGSVLICIVSHFMVESSDSPKTDVATGPPHNIHIVKKGNPINVRYGVHTGSNHGSQRNVPKVILANEAEPNRITGASASQRLGFQRKPHLRFLNQKLLAYRNRVYAINNGKINIDGVMYGKYYSERNFIPQFHLYLTPQDPGTVLNLS